MIRRAAACLVIALVLHAGTVWGEEVTFRFEPSVEMVVETVSLRGDFNGWGETPLKLQGDGSWSLTIDLEQGEHAYKYFVNGQWPSDMETWHEGGPADTEVDGYVDDGYGGQNAVRILGGTTPIESEETGIEPAPPLRDRTARVHYHRPDGRYRGWGLHLWEDTEEQVSWTDPQAPRGQDAYGIYWDFRLSEEAERVGLIIHKGEAKDPGPDMFLVISKHGREVWLFSNNTTILTEQPDLTNLVALTEGDLSRQRAHWVERGTIAWAKAVEEGFDYRLHFAPQGGLRFSPGAITGGETIPLTLDPTGLPDSVRERFPHLADSGVLKIPEADLDRVRELLKGQVAVSMGTDEKLLAATGIQIPGVLDELFTYSGDLGVSWSEKIPTLRLWAPTARSVRVHLFERVPSTDTPSMLAPMSEQKGVWSLTGESWWKGMFYLYEVEVCRPSTGEVERNLVTDPYSRSLATNSSHSQIVDLDDPDLLPNRFATFAKPPLDTAEKTVLYELHLRDFSASDPSVPEEFRGTYLAFTLDSNGTRHLKRLAGAGVTHIHLLPTFDIATIDEDRSRWLEPGDLSGHASNSEEQQAAVATLKEADPYNWGYDPFHYGVPEGSYATEPNGAPRILEFRRMVQALSQIGLRVVMDVVYNHTNASGAADKSILDRIVPGYYHRLDSNGQVVTSTCCANTASEHAMMERLMIDDLVHWATDYRIDGFRFDLMGHHMKQNMVRAAERLRNLTMEEDGVDGSKIVLYGEGWDFGEVAGNARGINATQINLAGTGIGTFNDRIRDAARGGNPFNDRREQGFLTGRFYDPNGFQSDAPSDRDALLEQIDRIRIGLAGNLAGFQFTDRTGRTVSGRDYGGYTAQPGETINYVSAHDNETLFDKIQFAASPSATIEDRVRMQKMGISLIGLGQGIPFFHAGTEILRSKSLDADSYNSGDWFNRIDFTYQTNNFGVGLPPAEKNRARWSIIREILARTDIVPGEEEILSVFDHFEEILSIRRSSPLFTLQAKDEVQARIRFHNTGPNQIPGLIVMSLSDTEEGWPQIDSDYKRILVLFNANREDQIFRHPGLITKAFELHPVCATSRDDRVGLSTFDGGSGSFRVPARTTVVFVER